MSAYTNQVKDYVERYKTETGNDGLLDPHEVAAWALHNGLHKGIRHNNRAAFCIPRARVRPDFSALIRNGLFQR